MNLGAAIPAFFLVALGGCAEHPVPVRRPVNPSDAAAWQSARKDLDALRRAWGATAGTMHLSVRFSARATGTVMSGRGVVAVDPPHSLRMILLGPGGSTAMDLLVHENHWRLSIPPRDETFRDTDDANERVRALPVHFLRWWLLTPLEGRLIAAWQRDGRYEWVLRADGAVTDIVLSGGLIDVTRRGASVEHVVAVGGPCGRARYENEDVGLVVEVECEAWRPGPPQPRAFELGDQAPGR
jgi:hypothetical protein